MKKEELRKVLYTHKALKVSNEFVPETPVKFNKKGLFHKWETQVDEQGSQYSTALIETETGEMINILSDQIRFDD